MDQITSARLLVGLAASIATWLASMAFGVVDLQVTRMAQQNKMIDVGVPVDMVSDMLVGYGDLTAFSFWTIGLSIAVFPVVWLLAGVRSMAMGLLSCLIMGFITASIWTAIVGWVLGDWTGAFSVRVLYCWVSGAVLGMLCGVLLSRLQR